MSEENDQVCAELAGTRDQLVSADRVLRRVTTALAPLVGEPGLHGPGHLAELAAVELTDARAELAAASAWIGHLNGQIDDRDARIRRLDDLVAELRKVADVRGKIIDLHVRERTAAGTTTTLERLRPPWPYQAREWAADETRVECFSGRDPSDVIHEGVVVGMTEAPTVRVQKDDGQLISWVLGLTRKKAPSEEIPDA